MADLREVFEFLIQTKLESSGLDKLYNSLSPEQLKKLQANLQKAIRELQKELGKAGEDWGRSFVTAFQSMTVWGTAASVIYGTMRQIREFAQEIQTVNALQTKMATALGTQRASQFLSESIRLAQEYGASWDKVAEASIEWGKSVDNNQEAFEGLRRSVELGIATYSDFTNVSKGLIVLSKQLNLSYEDQEKALTALYTIYQRFPSVNIDQLLQNVQKAASQASALGVTFNQLIAFMAHAQQIDPAFGFFGVSSFFSDIVKQKDKIIPFLQQFGIEIKSDGQWLAQLLQQFSKWTPQQQLQFAQFFGQFGANVRDYFLKNGQDLLNMLDQIGEGSGKLAQAIDTYSNSLQAAYNRLKDAQAEVAKNAQTVFVPAMATVTDTLRGIVQSLANMGPAGGLLIGGGIGGLGLLFGSKIVSVLMTDLSKNAPSLYQAVTEGWQKAGGAKGVILPLAITFALRYLVDATGIGGKLEKVTGIKDLTNIIFDTLMQAFAIRAIAGAFGLSKGLQAGLSLAIPIALTLIPRLTGNEGLATGVGQLMNIATTSLMIRSMLMALAKSVGGTLLTAAEGAPGWAISIGLTILLNFDWESNITPSNNFLTKTSRTLNDIVYTLSAWALSPEQRKAFEAYRADATEAAQATTEQGNAAEQAAQQNELLLQVMEKLTDQAKMLNSIFGAMPQNLQNLNLEAQILEENFKQALQSSNLTPEQRSFLEKISGTATIQRGNVTLFNPLTYGGTWPVTGGYTDISGYFGQKNWFKTGVHYGVDIPAPLWTPVVAPRAGTVVEAGWTEGWGYRVVLEFEDGVRMLFGHLASILVEAGQKVKEGELIGQVGGTAGKEWGGGGPNELAAISPHLHWEAWLPEGTKAEVTPEEIQSWVEAYEKATTPEEKQWRAGLFELASSLVTVKERIKEITEQVQLWNIGLDNAQMQLDLSSIAVENYDRQLQNLPTSIDNVAQRTTILQGKQDALIRQYLTYQMAISATQAYIAELQNQLAQATTEEEQIDIEKKIQTQTVNLERMKSEAQATADALAEVNKQLLLIGYKERVQALGMEESNLQATLEIQMAKGMANTEDQLRFYNRRLDIVRQEIDAQLAVIEALEKQGATTEELYDANAKLLDLKKDEAQIEDTIAKLNAQQAIYRRLQQALPGGLAGTWASVARWLSGPLPEYITQGKKETTQTTLEEIKEQIERYVITPFDNLADIIQRIGDLTKTWGDLISQGYSGIYLKFTDITQEIFTMASGFYSQINAELRQGLPPAGSWAAKLGMKGIWVPELEAIAPGLSPQQAQAWMDRQRLKMEQMEKDLEKMLWGPVNAAVFEEFRRRGATAQELQGFQQWILTYSILSKYAPYILQALPEQYRLPKEQLIEPERAMAMVTMERPDIVMQATIEGETMGNIIAQKIQGIEHNIYVNVDLGHGLIWRSQLTAPDVAASGVGMRVNAI